MRWLATFLLRRMAPESRHRIWKKFCYCGCDCQTEQDGW